MPDGVMAAQVTLTHLVMVRIHVGQPVAKEGNRGTFSITTLRELGGDLVDGEDHHRLVVKQVGNFAESNGAVQ